MATNTENHSLILQTSYPVTSADTDMEARLRAGSLVNMLIQSAINSADNLGFGYSGIRQQKLFWVLSRLTVEIYQPLKWYQEAKVETWPKDIDGILYLRDFKVTDSSNNLAASAVSGWLAIDLSTRRPKRIEATHEELFTSLKDRHALPAAPDKLGAVKDGETFMVRSTYFDIDLNKHVTSTRYIDWMMDTFPLDHVRSKYPRRISINFMKETMPGETMVLKRMQESENLYTFEGSSDHSGASHFRGSITF